MVQHVDESYRKFLKEHGRIGELIDVDVISAIDLMVQNGQWDKALNTAKQQNVGLALVFNFCIIFHSYT